MSVGNRLRQAKTLANPPEWSRRASYSNETRLNGSTGSDRRPTMRAPVLVVGSRCSHPPRSQGRPPRHPRHPRRPECTGARPASRNEDVLDWVHGATSSTSSVVSVCTGALILGGCRDAGSLHGNDARRRVRRAGGDLPIHRGLARPPLRVGMGTSVDLRWESLQASTSPCTWSGC